MDWRDVKEFIKDSIGYIFIIVFAFLLFVYVIAFDEVYGNSMYPTYRNKDILVLSKITYKLSDAKAGDVIAFTDANGMVYIKRIIGIPGDDIYVKDNVLYINGYEKQESYLMPLTITSDFKLSDVCEVDLCKDNRIPDDYYFVMGDNREESLDSRQSAIGLIPKDRIIGKAIFRLWPLK